MIDFKDLAIPDEDNYKGDSIKIARLLNRQISVNKYKLVPSKQESGKMCLHMQIELNGINHVVFTGSYGLIKAIEKMPESKPPFKTTIVRENEWYKFT